MSALAVVQDAERSLKGLTLDELGEIVEREHEQVGGCLRGALGHALSCGAALLEAHVQCPYGEWGAWLARHASMERSVAQDYMRLAEYRDHIPSGHVTITRALKAIGDKPPRAMRRVLDAEQVAMAKDLIRDGRTYAEVGGILGVSHATVYLACNPRAHKRKRALDAERKRRFRAAKKALAEKERADAIAAKGGEIEKAYNLLRQAEQLVGRARPEVKGREAKEALDEALSSLARAIDKTWEAVSLG